MAEYSRFASGSYTVPTGVTKPIYLPFQPTRVHLLNSTTFATNTEHLVNEVWWDYNMGQGTALMTKVGAATTYYLTTDTVATNGISTFGAGLTLQYSAPVLLGASGSISKHATAPVVTTTADHGLSTGDVVVFQNLYQTASTGMPQIAGIPFVVTVTGATTFTIGWNTNQSNYTAIATGGLNTLAQFKKVLYPYLYLPNGIVPSIMAQTGSSIAITTTVNHNLVVGQEVAFRIPSAYGSTELNSLPDSLIPGSPVYYYVSAVNSNIQFTITGAPTITAFATNQTVASVPGLTFPQVIPAGDVNTGGAPYSGGNLYPSPSFPTSSGGVSTINGPAIQGAFVNNTRQGFTIGNGVGVIDSSAVMGGVAGNTMLWEAWLTDIGN